jgi:hypothetical protein
MMVRGRQLVRLGGGEPAHPARGRLHAHGRRDRQFLIYAYFSSGTPSAMARTFQAYQCDYAMLLDMNSQELTYMALYLHEGDEIEARHLVSGMADVDVRGSRGTASRASSARRTTATFSI